MAASYEFCGQELHDATCFFQDFERNMDVIESLKARNKQLAWHVPRKSLYEGLALCEAVASRRPMQVSAAPTSGSRGEKVGA